MANNQTIIRTRNQERAQEIARRMAGMVQRTFTVTKYDARTWEVSSQRMNLPDRELNAYRNVAQALIRIEKCN